MAFDHPAVSSLLLTIGFTALIIEVYRRVWLAGTVGIVSILLFGAYSLGRPAWKCCSCLLGLILLVVRSL